MQPIRFRLFASTAHVAVGAVALSITSVAAAQDAPAVTSGLEEIVVTAQRRSENLQDVPIAVTAVTQQSLIASNVNSTLDLTRVAPGLVGYQIGSSFQPYIRGVGSNQSPPGFESPVALYVDGVYQGYKGSNVSELGDLERIEVLKGPQGTLFGRNATGGAINIITRDPGSSVEVEAQAGYGRFDEKHVKAYIAGPITDTLSASMSFSGRWDDGYIYDYARDVMANPARYNIATAKLVWEPNEDFRVKLSGRYADRRDNTFGSHHLHPGTVSIAASQGHPTTYGDYETGVSFNVGASSKSYAATLNMEYDLGSVNLVSITGYKDDNSLSQSDGDVSPATLTASGTKQPSKQFSQEIQLQSDSDGPFKWILGGYYMWFREGFGKPGENLISASNVPFPVRPVDLTQPGASAVGITGIVTTNAYAAFAEATYELTERDRITAGLRYNDEKKGLWGELYSYTAVPGSGQGQPLFGTAIGSSADGLMFGRNLLNSMDASKSWSELTWRITYDHRFNDDVMVYASYNRGFKSGGYNPAVISPTQVPVNPEKIDAYEIGLKGEFLDRRLRLNAAGFYYDYQDIQIGLITGPGLQTVQNAASAKVYGLDLDLLAAPTDNLTLRAALNLLDTKYGSFPNAQAFLPRVEGVTCETPARRVDMATALAIAGGVPTGGNCSYSLDVTGQDLIFAPKLTAQIGADYEIPMAGGSTLILSGSLYYNDGFDVSPGGIFAHVDSYETLALSLTWKAPDDRFFVRLWGDNVTDDVHPVYISNQAQAVQVVNNRPATYGITVGFRLGN